MSLLYYNKIRDGGVACFMGGPATCLTNVPCALVELILGWKGGNAFTLIVTQQW